MCKLGIYEQINTQLILNHIRQWFRKNNSVYLQIKNKNKNVCISMIYVHRI